MSDRFAKEVRLIEDSLLFDGEWYLRQYADVTELGMGAAEHYLRFGARMLRDPGPRFSTRFYLDGNQDVRKAGLNPLVHYLRHGRLEGRAPLAQVLEARDFTIGVDVVVPVFNALDDVKECIASVARNRDGFRVGLIVVNDGSDPETTEWLRKADADHRFMRLIENEGNLGYTRSVNVGLRASTADHVVTLNSDTIVTPGWLRGLVRCMASDPRIGIVGPLSNAASWQNVPDLYDASGVFAINKLQGGMSPDDMGSLVRRASARQYPRTPFVNGFCFMIKREVIDSIGFMDEDNFPLGYGEENDFCIRAADAGFALAIADDSYVYHAKSKSFGHERRVALSRQGSESLKKKHTSAKFGRLVQEVKRTEVMDGVRGRIGRALAVAVDEAEPELDPMRMRVLFLLPVGGGGGGAHSVVQEVVEMRRLGMNANVAVKMDRVDSFIDQYKDVPEVASTFVGFSDADLLRLASGYDVVIATIYSSMKLVRRICEAMPHILPAYYVQDYEPLFFPKGSKEWQVARSSYDLVANAVLFAKTHWIMDKVHSEHGVVVNKVEPSIDHAVYRPSQRISDGRIHVSAMIRPQTPRRGAERTMRVFSSLARRYPGRLAFHLFGCDPGDEGFLGLARDFDFQLHGRLLRPEVAALLSRCDLFVDLSDYQAFGRTALEAMACGCAAVVPVHGGADEYAIADVNALVVDSLDEAACIRGLDDLIQEAATALPRMRSNGLVTAARFSVHQAAVSEWSLLGRSLPLHRKLNPAPARRLLVFPSTTKGGGTITGSGYVRVALPYFSDDVLGEWLVRTQPPGSLPNPGEADVFMIQRDAPGISLSALQDWAEVWRSNGGRLIYEIDDDLLDVEGLQSRGYTGDVLELGQKVDWLVRNANLVTVSTQPLAERLGARSANVRVVPNRLDRRLWRLNAPRNHDSGPFARDENVVRIGYIGTPSHDRDLDLVSAVMRRIEAEFAGRVEIEVIGGFERRTPTFGKRVGLPRKHDYPNFVAWLDQRVHWDVGIIPLVDDAFNHSKSHVKFLEYAALDMAIVCSGVTAYETVARHEENALVVSNREQAWYDAIKRLILDASLRSRLAESARNMVKSEYTLDHASADYLELLAEQLQPSSLRGDEAIGTREATSMSEP